MERVIWADIAYPIDYVPRGARTQRRDWVLEAVPLTVKEARAEDLPLVAEADVSNLQGDGRLTRKVFRSFGRGLVERAYGLDGQPLRPEHLETSPSGPNRTWSVVANRYPFARSLPYVKPGAQGTRPGDLDIRKEVRNGREAALRYATSNAERTLVDGDAVWVPSRTLCWSLTKRGRVLDIKPVRTSQTGRLFHSLEAAKDFAEWLVKQPALHSYRNEINVTGGITLHAPQRLPKIPSLNLALRDLEEIASMDHGSGFPTLPLAALEAWCDFRRALRAADAGDAGRVGEAYAALAALVEALPPLKAGAEEYRLATNRMQVNVPISVRYHDGYLAGLLPKPTPEETDGLDAEALGLIR